MTSRIEDIKNRLNNNHPNLDGAVLEDEFNVSDIAWLIEENLQLKEKVRELVNNDTAMSTTMNKYVNENKQLQSQLEKYKKVVEAADLLIANIVSKNAFKYKQEFDKAIANLEEVGE